MTLLGDKESPKCEGKRGDLDTARSYTVTVVVGIEAPFIVAESGHIEGQEDGNERGHKACTWQRTKACAKYTEEKKGPEQQSYDVDDLAESYLLK